MKQGFDEWYFKQNHLGIEPIDHARESYKAGAASRQAEIDELQKRLNLYEREGYKLVPVEATDAQWEAAIDAYSIAMDGKDILSASAFYDIYEAMIGAVE